MYYVYLLRSIKNPSKTYTGYTTDLRQRLDAHNSGSSDHTKDDRPWNSVYTKDYRPWELVMYLAFQDQETAKQFECYLKSATGRAFISKHLLKKD